MHRPLTSSQPSSRRRRYGKPPACRCKPRRAFPRAGLNRAIAKGHDNESFCFHRQIGIELHLHKRSPVRLHHTAAPAMKSYIVSKLCSCLSRSFSSLQPQRRIDGQRTGLAGPRIEERAVIVELAVAKELSQHRKRLQRERRVDEWLLAVQRLDCGTARKWIFPGIGIRGYNSLTVRRRSALRLFR